jgi:signal transduction histidine kinase
MLQRNTTARRFFKSDWSNFPHRLRILRAPLLVAIAYYAGARMAFAVGTLSDHVFAPFWPPNVVLFCALIFVPKRQWWWYIAAVFPSHVIAEHSVGMPVVQMLVAFATNCMLATLNAYGLRWFLKERPWLSTFSSSAIYVLVTAAAGPAIAAFGGALVQNLDSGEFHHYWTYWGNWYLSNALGSVTLGTAFLAWFDRRAHVERWNSRRTVEAFILTLSLGIVCTIVFHTGRGTVQSGFLPAVLYSPIPFLLWAAIRFGQRGASGAILVVTVVSIWENLHDPTVFIGPERNVLALQVFLFGLSVSLFLLAAAIDELSRTGEAMRELAGALLRVQDEERRRIARELHDSTGQNLAVAGLTLSRIKDMVPESCSSAIAELNEIIRQSMVEIRTVSYLLHPPMLDGIGFDIALRAYVGGFSKRTGIRVELSLPPMTERMPSSVELVLFRVIQEALTNVWRHSGSQTARIELSQDGGNRDPQVTLCIEDFGKGIPYRIRATTLSSTRRPVPVGLGLVSMRERLHQIGGALEIDSASGKTVIRAIVKLNAPVPVH